MRGDLIETFKIISGISNYVRHFFKISPRIENLLSWQISKTKSTYQLEFFANSNIFLKKLPNQIKNSNRVKILF